MTKEKEKTSGNKRSGKWPTLRKKFLKGKSCAVCGGNKKLEAHHIKDFRDNPELELVESNLIALCEGDEFQNHHLQAGHLGNFQMVNPEVVKDSKCWGRKIKCAKNVLKRLKKKGKR